MLSMMFCSFLAIQVLWQLSHQHLPFCLAQVVNGEEKISDWKECFTTLMEKADQELS